jgi:hypothetical protein
MASIAARSSRPSRDFGSVVVRELPLVALIGAYHRCVADTVGQFGGFVAK